MNIMILRLCVLLASTCLAGATAPIVLAASPDAEQARRIAEQYVTGKQSAGGNPQEGYEAGDVVVTDLDGDGQDEIVVLWTMYGPTYWNHGVAVLAKNGARYMPAGETLEPLGSVEAMTVRQGVVELKTKWPGPDDPRCCPSVAKTLRYRWTPGKLTPVK
ncbi:hypothetical protein FB548_2865 [Pseudoxanthomonas sp. 3HH-4]|uniref:hypothetical protein n=1 Tax=Pseudoxanthomonas sp. 3HH-4 TaxID=1690214 RepID=UPI001153FFA2|nr:hypothetical protein [Pseudoxanthomonas sp. 3HH-4]TQM10661.1 hypothetical protein FB548_2865 [Pseudoxanthomonas sp. 3HH-4]